MSKIHCHEPPRHAPICLKHFSHHSCHSEAAPEVLRHECPHHVCDDMQGLLSAIQQPRKLFKKPCDVAST